MPAYSGEMGEDGKTRTILTKPRHPDDIQALADLGLRGLHPPPPFWSENFTKKRSILAIFRASTPSFLDRIVDKSSHERLATPPLSKISRSPMYKCDSMMDMGIFSWCKRKGGRGATLLLKE